MPSIYTKPIIVHLVPAAGDLVVVSRKSQRAFSGESALLLTILGPEHSHTLSSMANMAQIWRSLGRREDAISLGTSFQLIETRLGLNNLTLNLPLKH